MSAYKLLFGLLMVNSISYGVINQDWRPDSDVNIGQEKPAAWYMSAQKAYNDNSGLIKTVCGVAIVAGGIYVVSKQIGDLPWVTHKQFMLRSAALEAVVHSSKLEVLARVDLLETNLAKQIKDLTGLTGDVKNMAIDSNLKLDKLAANNEETKKLMIALVTSLRQLLLHMNEVGKVNIPAAALSAMPATVGASTSGPDNSVRAWLKTIKEVNDAVSEFAFPGSTKQ